MSRTIQNLRNLTEQQQAALMEQRYYVLQDLDNVLGIFAESAEVIKFFQEIPDHQMVTNAQNRFIAQVNISNAFHFDQKDDHDPLLAGNLKDLKTLAKEYFKELRQSISFTDKIDHVADHYMNQNLDENNILQQLDGVKSNSTTEFNAKTLQKIIDSMNQMDTLMGNIRAGQKVDIPTKNQFLQKMQARQLNAQNQLKQNFQKEYQESLNRKQQKENKIDEEKVIQFNDNENEQVVGKEENDNDDFIGDEEGGISVKYTNDMKSQFVKQSQYKKEQPNLKISNCEPNLEEQQKANSDTQSNDQSEQNQSEKIQEQTAKNENIDNPPQNQNIKDLDNDNIENTIYNKIIEYLMQILEQLKYLKLEEQAFQNVIICMKKEIYFTYLVRIFENIEKLFNNSEMSKLIKLILKDIQKINSKINLSGIVQKNISMDEIKKLEVFIQTLEQEKNQVKSA